MRTIICTADHTCRVVSLNVCGMTQLSMLQKRNLKKIAENPGVSQGLELISVAEAIRRSSGKVAVKGMIIGLSSVEQVVTCTEFDMF